MENKIPKVGERYINTKFNSVYLVAKRIFINKDNFVVQGTIFKILDSGNSKMENNEKFFMSDEEFIKSNLIKK